MGSFGGFLGEERLLADDQGIVLFKPEKVATDVASKNLGNLVSRVRSKKCMPKSFKELKPPFLKPRLHFRIISDRKRLRQSDHFPHQG